MVHVFQQIELSCIFGQLIFFSSSAWVLSAAPPATWCSNAVRLLVVKVHLSHGQQYNGRFMPVAISSVLSGVPQGLSGRQGCCRSNFRNVVAASHARSCSTGCSVWGSARVETWKPSSSSSSSLLIPDSLISLSVSAFAACVPVSSGT